MATGRGRRRQGEGLQRPPPDGRAARSRRAVEERTRQVTLDGRDLDIRARGRSQRIVRFDTRHALQEITWYIMLHDAY